MDFIAYWLLGVGGSWIIGDGIFSWTLYHNAVSYENNRKQSFLKDHWVRLVRIIIGVLMTVGGWYLT